MFKDILVRVFFTNSFTRFSNDTVQSYNAQYCHEELFITYNIKSIPRGGGRITAPGGKCSKKGGKLPFKKVGGNGIPPGGSPETGTRIVTCPAVGLAGSESVRPVIMGLGHTVYVFLMLVTCTSVKTLILRQL